MNRTTRWFQPWTQARTAVAPPATEGRARGRERNRLRPSILPLEDRRLLAAIVVNNVSDTNVGGLPLVGSLRWAVDLADEATAPTTITFTLGNGPQSINLVNGPIELTNSADATTIDGLGANELTVNGKQNSTVFIVDNGVTASISGMTITGGSSKLGGGVYNGGTLTLSTCTISGNSATDDAGGVYNAGTVMLSDCTLSGNSAPHDGGALFNNGGTTDLTDCTLSGNLAVTNGKYQHSDGSAVFNSSISQYVGTVNLINGTISGNSASDGGYALYTASGATSTLEDSIVAGDSGGEIGGTGTLDDTDHDLVRATAGVGSLGNYGGSNQTIPLLPGSPAIGAGIAINGVSTDERGMLIGSEVDIGAFQSSVVVESTSGDLDTDPTASTLTLPDAVSLADQFAGAAIGFDPAVFGTATPQTITLGGSQLELSNTALSTSITGPDVGVTVSGAGASRVFQLDQTVNASFSGLTITDGSAIVGAGVFNVEGDLALTDCAISGNVANDKGGGVNNYGGTTTFTNCTISGNKANNGGGIFAGLNHSVAPTSEFINTTIADNTAASAGGGLYDHGTETISDCTISGNNATSGGGLDENGQSALENTIIAGNSEGSGQDIDGSGTLAGSYNLVGTMGTNYFSSPSDVHNVFLTAGQSPSLGSLGNYGGLTNTIPLLPGSPALDAGMAGSGIPTTDERGEPRFGPTDIGAFESQGFTLAPEAGSTGQDTLIDQPFPDALTVTVTANNPKEPVSGGTVTFESPSSGSSATLVEQQPFVINASGQISVNATANGIGGSYDVTVIPGGTESGTSIALTNQIQPVFSVPNNVSIVYGQTAPLAIEGTIQAGTTTPTGNVKITLESITQSVTIGSGGSFSTDFNVADLPVLSSNYTISYFYAANGDLLSATGGSTLTVTPAPLTITANNASKVYGAALPSFSASYSGFVNGDTAASLTTPPTLTTTATAASPVAAAGYSITAAGAVDGNYSITYVAGKLTVTPAPLTITADNASKVYGAALPSFSASYSGLVNGDTPASLTTPPTLTTTASAASPVAAGGYSITAAGAVDGNYTITYGFGTLTITPAPLTIAANNVSTVYGAALPALSATYTGLVNGDTAASLTTPPTLATTGSATSPVVAGGYSITAAGAADGNYAITYVVGRLTVTPAPLTIAADNASKVYGTALPSLSATYAGFVNGDTAASLTTPPTLTTTATAASLVVTGGYSITAAGAVDGNYAITYVAGTLTVTPAPLTITANNVSTVYGAALPALSATYTGLVNGDTAASLTTAPKLTTTAIAASPVVAGGYPITAAGAADGNYTITYVAGTLTVTRVTPSLSVSASGGTYDGSPFPASVTVAGSSSGIAPAASLEGVAPDLVYYVGSGTSGTPLGSTPPSAPGTYTVVASFGGSVDYTAVQSAPVTFTIDQGTATVGLSSLAGSTVYGQPVTFTATVTDGVISGTVTFSEGGTTLGEVALSGSDTATLTTSALGVGSQLITASYSGNADFTGATSGPAAVSVARAATQVVLVPHPVFKKKTIVSLGLEAEIAPVGPGGGLPSGTVTFEVRKTKKKEIILGTLSLGGGAATLAVKPNSVLNKLVTILYSGGANFQASTTAFTLTSRSLTSMARPMVSFPRRK